ncbi:hypothetical protein MVEG_10911 [Podila verticillata NRRL 6337]|nr:hypothetical protein MVEG_10911 [Podila verticillata NRRL 6337]
MRSIAMCVHGWSGTGSGCRRPLGLLVWTFEMRQDCFGFRNVRDAHPLSLPQKEKTILYAVGRMWVVIGWHVTEADKDRAKVFVIRNFHMDQIKEVLINCRNGLREHSKIIVGTSGQSIGDDVHRTGSIFNFIIEFGKFL